jgi:hypothetical protein
MPAKRTSQDEPADSKDASKSRISQSDVPSYSLDQALRVPRAIGDSYAYKPTKPLGDTLDGDATIRLLEAINELKKHPLPLRYANESALSS